MGRVRAVLVRFRNGEEEWVCATHDGESWMVPDTQCGGFYPLDETMVLRSVDIPPEAQPTQHGRQA